MTPALGVAPESFTTARLSARRPIAADEAFLVEMWSDPRLTDWLGGRRDRVAVRGLLAHWEVLWSDGATGVWILCDRATDQPLGWVLLHPMDFGGQTGTEVGWAIHPDRWRQGFASEAAARVVDIGFTDCGHDELLSGTMITNVASQGVMRKIGFTFDGEVEHAGLPHVLYRLDRGAWEARGG